jgi:site-specific DNA-methyltransferase (adenine-specific)
MLDFGFYNMDCMEGMKQFPDNFFDLAIVDPPYGIGVMTMNYTKSGAVRTHGYAAAKRRDYRKQAEWDVKPDQAYFNELFRVAKRKIIWGGNYFSDMLPPSKSFIVWDKRCNDAMRNDFADCEYAWADYGVARMFRFVWNGMIQGNMKDKEERFHPTQKPVALYEWILNNYAKPGDKILDTHVGSASSLVACHNLGFDFVGFELDPEYFKKSSARLEDARAQTSIFDYLSENQISME